MATYAGRLSSDSIRPILTDVESSSPPGTKRCDHLKPHHVTSDETLRTPSKTSYDRIGGEESTLTAEDWPSARHELVMAQVPVYTATDENSCVLEQGGAVEPARRVKGNSQCPHGKRKNLCRACGGASLCSHGKEKAKCKECGGSSVCTHGRVRSRCKECKGGSMCIHSKLAAQCRDCGGSAFCKHNKRKYSCKACKELLPVSDLSRGEKDEHREETESQVEGHEGREERGKQDRGLSLAEKAVSGAKEGEKRSAVCTGPLPSSLKAKEQCEHGKRRCRCAKCGGSSICVHERERSKCKECGGASTCEHGKQRSRCKECGGASLCEHGRYSLSSPAQTMCDFQYLRSRCE